MPEGRQGIEQERYLTITIERKNFEEAKAQFATIEASVHKAFGELGAEIAPLSGNERIKVLYDYYHLGDENSFDFDIREARKVGADFRNDLCNGMIQFYPDYFKDEKKFCRALFIKKYPSSLSDRFLNEITSLPVQSISLRHAVKLLFRVCHKDNRYGHIIKALVIFPYVVHNLLNLFFLNPLVV